MNVTNMGYLLFGIFIGQEYGKHLPNVNNIFFKLLEEIKKHEIYKNYSQKK